MRKTKETWVFVSGEFYSLVDLIDKIDRFPDLMIPKKGIIWIYN